VILPIAVPASMCARMEGISSAAASRQDFAYRLATKVNMLRSPEKMRWLIDRLLQTSSPTTGPRAASLSFRRATREILKGFHRI